MVHRSFLQKQDNTHCHGYYIIPYDVTSGSYQLIAIAQTESTGEMVPLVKKHLPIFNDTDSPEPQPIATNQHLPGSASAWDLSISVEVTPSELNTRGEARLSVEVQDEFGKPVQADLSVAVTDIGLIGNDFSGYSTLSETQVTQDDIGSLSEYISISGYLERGQNDMLMSFFMPSRDKIYYTTSVQDGGV